MASLQDLYKKSEISKKVAKKIDRTPISANDFDLKKLSVSNQNLEKARGGKLGTGVGGYTPIKQYSAKLPK
jgi:hypothetical protein